MKNNLDLLLIALSICCYSAFAQPKKTILDSLEVNVTYYNDHLKYDESLKLLNNILVNNSDSYSRYYAFLLKSYTHKRVFDYKEALISLDSAAVEGKKSNKRNETATTIKAERAFIFFDLQNYNESKILMEELKATNYKYINISDQAFITMQLGYIDYLNSNYIQAEILYNSAIEKMKISGERNLPMIYGKKVELYGSMKKNKELNKAFDEGLKIAEKYGILKYKIYMYESLRLYFIKNLQYKEAYLTSVTVDSLKYIYDSDNYKASAKLTVQKLLIVEKDAMLKNINYLLWFLFTLSICLVIIVILIYYLWLSRKRKHQLLENEYNHIYKELTLLTSDKENKENRLNDLSKSNLSNKQIQIVEFLRAGKSNKQIAQELCISENTVKYHLKVIYENLKMQNRTKFQTLY